MRLAGVCTATDSGAYAGVGLSCVENALGWLHIDALEQYCPTEVAACVQAGTCAAELMVSQASALQDLWQFQPALQAVLLCGYIHIPESPLGYGVCSSHEIGRMSRLVLPTYCQVGRYIT